MRIKTLISATLASLLLVACDSGTSVVDKNIEVLPRPAKLLEIHLKNMHEFLNYPAVVQSRQLSVLSFEVGGMLNELNVLEAQNVVKGEVLATLDQRDLKAKVASAQAQYKNANSEYQRALRLIKQNAISKSKLGERKSKREVNKAQLETAQKALQDAVLIAPFAGAIAKISIEKQQIIQAGKPAITLLGKAGLEAVFNLPSSIVARVKRKEEASRDSYLILNVAPDREIPIRFKEAALEADAASQTYAVTFAFDKPEDLNILPGMNAVVWLKDPSKPAINNKILIPLTSIAVDGEQKYVWVLDKNTMLVARRDITIEADVGERAGVSSGLQVGEVIVEAGVALLAEGMKVSKWSK